MQSEDKSVSRDVPASVRQFDKEPVAATSQGVKHAIGGQINPAFDPFDSWTMLRVLYKHKWKVIGTALLGFGIAFIAMSSIVPEYRATASVLIQSKAPKVVNIDQVLNADNTERDYLKTEIEVLKSRRIAGRVIDKLNLAQNPEFSKKESDAEMSWWMKGIGLLSSSGDKTQADAAKDPDRARDLLIDAVSKKINVQATINTYVVRVSADAVDAKLSADLANAVVDAYVDEGMSNRFGVNQQASDWLTQRLTELKQQLETSEKNLQDFYEKEKLVSAGGVRTLEEEDLTDNSRRLREAHKTRTDLENVYRSAVKAGENIELLQELPLIQQEALVQTTKKSYLDAKEQVRDFESRYGTKYPKMLAAQARLDETYSAYRKQVLIAAQGIRSQYENAKSTEDSLANVVDSSRGHIQNLDRKQAQIENLKREVETNNGLYKTFLERYKETDVSKNLEMGNTRLVDRAAVPRKPYKPAKIQWLASGLMLGFLLGAIVILLTDFLNDSIRSPGELEEILRAPTLSVLPLIEKKSEHINSIGRLTIEDPNSAFSEGIRTVRSTIQLSDYDGKKKKILVTSSEPSEGKTSIATNLAISLSEIGRTILVEADLRRPTISKVLNLPKDTKGVSEVVSGTASLAESLYWYRPDALAILHAGAPTSASGVLISSSRFSKLLEALSDDFEYVVIDSPPCQAVSDALLLAQHADAVIFAARADVTRKKYIKGAIKQLQNAKISIFGGVLNQADFRRGAIDFPEYYYYYKPYTYKTTTKA